MRIMETNRNKFDEQKPNPTTDANQSDAEVIIKSKPNKADFSNAVNKALFRKSDRLLRDNEQFEKYHSHKRIDEKVVLEQTAKKSEMQERTNVKKYYFKNLIT